MASIFDLRWHPLACKEWDMINEIEYQDLKTSIEKFGRNLVPIVYRVLHPGTDDEEKEYLDGRNRMRACLELGIEPRTERAICPDDEVPSLLQALNDLRRNEEPEVRRQRGLRLAQAGLSTRTIAAKLGVNQSTVARDIQRAQQEAEELAPGMPDPLGPIIGRNGKKYQRETVKKKQKQKPEGAQLFDWTTWQSLLGQVVRGIDACQEACGNGKHCKEEFGDIRKKFLGLDDALRAAFNAHNGKGAKAPNRNRERRG